MIRSAGQESMMRPLLITLRQELGRRLRRNPAGNREVYFSHPNVRILLLARNGAVNVIPSDDKEIRILRDAWYPVDVAASVRGLRTRVGEAGERIHFLSNTEEIHRERRRARLNSHFVNINCFIDENVFRPDPVGRAKVYDAVAIGRFSWYRFRELKRHDLMSGVESLALLDPVSGTTDQKYKRKYCSRGNCAFWNRRRLAPREVAEILQASHCGLILSAHEGACRASCEYLATGLPVVSTPSAGGRDVWYDDYNSLIVDPDPDSVRAAVEHFKSEPRDPEVIRRGFLETARVFRERFRNEVIAPILEEHGIGMSPEEFLRENPFFWWPRELKRRRMGTADVVPKFDDFGIGNVLPEVIEYLLANVPRGSKILEFGSGLSSRELSRVYDVVSIEHDPEYVGRFHQQYIHSELQEEDLHYREEDCREAFARREYDVVIVDGPPAYRMENRKARLGFQKYVEGIGRDCIVIFDDVQRFWDCLNAAKTYRRLRREVVVISDGRRRSAVLTRNAADWRSAVRVALLLCRSCLYRYHGSIGHSVVKTMGRSGSG